MPGNSVQHDDASVLQVEVRDRSFIVVPAHNEEACIERVVRELRRWYPNVVVVDDGSTDGTFGAAARSATYVLRHLINRGQGAALQTGVQYALSKGARFVVTFDADGQHRVEDIHVLLEPIWRDECDIALGSRFLGQAVDIPPLRRFMLRIGTVFTRLVSRVRLTDAHNGMRAFSRRAARKIDITLDGMAHASELIDIVRRSGLRFREVPVRVHYTTYSLAKKRSVRDALRIVIHYLLGRFLH